MWYESIKVNAFKKILIITIQFYISHLNVDPGTSEQRTKNGLHTQTAGHRLKQHKTHTHI